MPFLLLGCLGLLVLLGGGGAVGGYFLYLQLTRAADNAKQAVADAVKDADKLSDPKPDPNPPGDGGDPKATGDPKQPDGGTGDPKPPADKPDNPAKPPPPPAGGNVVQPVAVSLPVDGELNKVFGVLFAGPQANQAVVAVKSDNKIRLDRYDLAAGRKLDSTDTPDDVFTAFRDVSPDGALYMCNFASGQFSVWQLPDAKPIIDHWGVPPPPKITPATAGGLMVVSAYLLDGGRLLTVNGLGQVYVWSIPEGKQLASYVPPESVAKYPAGLGGPNCSAVSPDKKKLAVFNGSDGFFVLDTAGLKPLGVVKSAEDAKPVPNAIFGVLGLAFSPDGGQLAAMFHQQKLAAKGGPPPYLVRWDLESKKVTARFADPTKVGDGSATKIAWWGPDYCWVYQQDGSGRSGLASWDKQAVVLKAAAKRGDRPCPGSPDGRHWYVVSGPDGKGVLQGVDRPDEALKQAGPDPDLLLKLMPDGIVKK